MKKWLVVSTLLFFTGCTALQPKRQVENNLFVSSTPKLYVKIDSEFKYVGNRKSTGGGRSVDGSRALVYTYDSYCFVKPDGNTAKRVVAIQIETISTHYISDIYRSKKDTIANGIAKCNGRFFQYYTTKTYPSIKKDITKLVVDKGYNMPYGILKCFGKIYGKDANTLVKIYYYERLSESDPDFKSVYGPKDLSSRERNFLKQFDKRAIASFEIGQ